LAPVGRVLPMKILLLLGAANGFFAVALGAFGAHGLRSKLGQLPDFAKRLEWWETASRYHLVHALFIVACALFLERLPGPWPVRAAWAAMGGILLFSGSLYVMTLTGVRVLGAVTPFGGLLLLAAWLCLAWAAVKS
jgi:uncharacterized membrane protein YgdD (TMEM256/DUF423 family)